MLDNDAEALAIPDAGPPAPATGVIHANEAGPKGEANAGDAVSNDAVWGNTYDEVVAVVEPTEVDDDDDDISSSCF